MYPGKAAGVAIGWLISGLMGAVIGGIAGAMVLDSYKQPKYITQKQSRRHYA